jgi:hypothetical protein
VVGLGGFMGVGETAPRYERDGVGGRAHRPVGRPGHVPERDDEDEVG